MEAWTELSAQRGQNARGGNVKRLLSGDVVIWVVTVFVLWFVVIAEVVAFVVWADAPAAAWIGVAVPAAVATGLSIGAFVLLRRERPREPLPADERAPRQPGRWRILVVANETLPGAALHAEIARHVREQPTDVLVIAPVLVGPIKYWTDEDDTAREQAQSRLDATCRTLGELTVSVSGTIGDADPLRAVEDALREFGADEIIVSTHPPGRSNWLEQHVVERLRTFYEIPISHVVVDAEQHAERWEGRRHTGRSA
jgi:GABA permease